MLQRPHRGEPLPLELVNTRWMSRGQPRDFLADDLGLGQWLSENGFTGPAEEARDALLEARDAIAEALAAPGDEAGTRLQAETRLNAVLAHGCLRLAVHGGKPVRTVECDDGWLPGWTAVSRYLELTETQSDRLRQCAHPDCVLYFHDTSRNGTRRWHSMETCGARSKAARHYKRMHTPQPGSANSDA
jgi:predicted RNA-binding Zn ribbon-like protein